MRFLPHLLAAIVSAWALGGCAPAQPAVQDLVQADVVLLGEVHDDAAHQRTHRDVVRDLAARGRLAAVAIEMAEDGTSTAALPRDAGEDAVRKALGWNDEGWPWAAYAPAVMEAVRAGVPVLGANLPRGRTRSAMGDAALDARLDPQALGRQREAIRAGHCDLLPEGQLGPMARVQVARDVAMARVIEGALVTGKTVVLLAGGGHVDPQLGVPRHLRQGLVVRPVLLPRSGEAPAKDYCADLRRQIGRPA
ncbi:MAG: hypothetical protein EOO24_34760 [Comamonadaceae bacterium]|nr:MAG: hypothetical protein EOO24_34760 [Comamonadaceae bacterium]